MARKIYVTNPQFSIPGTPDETPLCYTILDWEQGLPAVPQPPCNEETIVFLVWGDTAVEAKAKIIDNIVTRLGVNSNDIIFIGGWV